MKKKKQNNIGEFDLCSAAHELEFEIEPGYRLYLPWLHREFWEEQDLNQEPNQENEARTKQGEFTLEQRTNNGEMTFTKLKKDSLNREKKHNRSREEAVREATI